MYERVIKRLLDVTFAILLLLVLIIPMLIIAIIVKATSKGPVLFVQERFGKNSRKFNLLKFRSMQVNAPLVSNQRFDMVQAHVTTFGKVMRELSLDELPQVLNVLLGQMSFIGPRPLAESDLRVIELRRQTGADRVKPGITGWAQVNGRNNLDDEHKAAFDKEYSDDVSFKNDVKIVVLTIVNVIARTGINAD